MHIDEVREELHALGAEGFAARHGRWYLVVSSPDDVDSFAEFVNTASRESPDVLAGQRKLDAAEIHPLQTERRRSVRVGREGADVVLPSGKVSKLHAVFSFAGGLPSLADAGSKNGTWLNGAALNPNRPVPVDAGDTIQFSSISATLWSIDDLLAAARLP